MATKTPRVEKMDDSLNARSSFKESFDTRMLPGYGNSIKTSAYTSKKMTSSGKYKTG